MICVQLQIVTDIIHNSLIIFQATVVLLSSILIMRLFIPLPCFLVSLFSGSWQFAMLFIGGYWNCISFIQLCIIFQWTWVFDWECHRVLNASTVYAAVFAGVGIASDLMLVSIFRGFSSSYTFGFIPKSSTGSHHPNKLLYK